MEAHKDVQSVRQSGVFAVRLGSRSPVNRWRDLEERLPIPPHWEGIIWSHRSNSYDHPRHHHAALELNLVLSGHGYYEIEGVRHPLVPGSLLWIQPGKRHYLEERSADFLMWIVALEPSLVASACQAEEPEVLKPLRSPVRRLAVDDFRWLDGELHRLQGSGNVRLRRAGLAYGLLGAWEAFQRAAGEELPPPASTKVYRATLLLEANPALSRRSLADQLETHPDVLGRAFRQELGVGLVTYRNRLRIRRVLALMSRPGTTLLGACLDAGFGSYAQFHRVFTVEVGRTPREYLTPRSENEKSSCLG